MRRWLSRLWQVVKVTLLVALGALLLLVAFAASVYWYQQRRLASDLPVPVPPAQTLSRFRLKDPYAGPGAWYKVQLHAHTSRSLDAEISLAESVAEYRRQGFDFLFISDHDLTTPKGTTGAGETEGGHPLIVVPAEEKTIPFVLPFIGRHLLRLFVTEDATGDARRVIEATRRSGGLAVLAHPAWEGNAGAGRWLVRDVISLRGYNGIEVVSPYADTALNLRIWQAAAAARGPGAPVWLTAADDSHRKDMIGRNWLMVRAAGRTAPALKRALAGGSFYATTGLRPTFGVRDGRILVTLPAAATVRFFDARGQLRAKDKAEAGREVAYQPKGDEGFVRVEAAGKDGGAWSQPFWLMQEGSSQ